jgi:hypothetical protein
MASADAVEQGAACAPCESGAPPSAVGPLAAPLECFVCLEPGGVRVCACNVVVHPKCFTRLVRETPRHAERCGVCLQPYRGTQTTTVLRVRTGDPVVCIIYSTFLIFESTLFTTLYVLTPLTSKGAITLAAAAAFIAACTLLFHALYRRWTGAWCPLPTIQRVRTPTLVEHSCAAAPAPASAAPAPHLAL